MKRLAAGLHGVHAMLAAACSTLKPPHGPGCVSRCDMCGDVMPLPLGPETQAPPALDVSRMLTGPEFNCPLPGDSAKWPLAPSLPG